MRAQDNWMIIVLFCFFNNGNFVLGQLKTHVFTIICRSDFLRRKKKKHLPHPANIYICVCVSVYVCVCVCAYEYMKLAFPDASLLFQSTIRKYWYSNEKAAYFSRTLGSTYTPANTVINCNFR